MELCNVSVFSVKTCRENNSLLLLVLLRPVEKSFLGSERPIALYPTVLLRVEGNWRVWGRKW